jgi:hypothetical protein
MKTLEELRSFFENDLKSELGLLEERRVEAANKVKRFSLIVCVLFFVSLGLFFFIGVFAFILAGVLVFMWFIRTSKPR